jgi:3-oxoacyl-[acyl-carrier protein] reductase
MGDNPKVLWLSGGTRGIGRAVVGAFLSNGWSVASMWHSDEKAALETVGGFGEYGDRFFLKRCDVADGEQVRIWGCEARERMGTPDCVIHNAGETLNAPLLNVREEDWDATRAVHLEGARHLVLGALPLFLKNGGGQFIFISSVVATTGNPGQAAYASFKAALVGFMRSLAWEYGKRLVRCNAVMPGFHATRLSSNLTNEALSAIKSRHLLPETTDLDETTSFLLWLAGTRTISGQVFNLDSRIPGWL